MVTSFRLAPMSPVILILTLVLLLPPIPFFVAAFTHHRLFVLPALVLLFIDAWTYLWFRPTVFIVGPTDIEVIWPLRRRRIRRDTITRVRRLDRQALRRETGRAMRVGAGGLWGGFGWLWTTHRGLIRMYVSRIDNFIWIDRGHEQSWLITPEQPDVFVHALSGSHS
jgi:hypothetical protein